ncbi:MAG: YraN family protein [Dysosmobacter sp.]
MTSAKAAGDRGEALVARYLQKAGYTLLDRQWRCRFGELDLVARSREGIVCFVEVKLRGPESMGLPREAVDARKQARLRRTAGAYLSRYELDAPPGLMWRRSTARKTAPCGWSTWRARLNRESSLKVRTSV